MLLVTVLQPLTTTIHYDYSPQAMIAFSFRLRKFPTRYIRNDDLFPLRVDTNNNDYHRFSMTRERFRSLKRGHPILRLTLVKFRFTLSEVLFCRKKRWLSWAHARCVSQRYQSTVSAAFLFWKPHTLVYRIRIEATK